MDELVIKQTEIIESLVKLQKKLILLLSQYITVEEYEKALEHITQGDDVII